MIRETVSNDSVSLSGRLKLLGHGNLCIWLGTCQEVQNFLPQYHPPICSEITGHGAPSPLPRTQDMASIHGPNHRVKTGQWIRGGTVNKKR